ncbi:MAG TPA: TetR/AcrR family transcriptional regulator [Phycisphaerae bacterium]|nr:TetR/AcrR family transcriptional regulator [Phycisphaerae bacterium]
MPRHGKREQIMQVAEKLFASKRFHEITLDEIVREARVGKGTIYTYFEGKDDLFLQVATSGFEDLCDLLQRRVAESAPFREQLRQACQAVSAFFAGRRHLFRMMQTEDARMSLCRGRMHERWTQKRQLLVESLGKIFRRGQTDGLVRQDLPAETLAVFLLSMLRTRARDLRKDGGTVGDGPLVDLFLYGAGQPAPPSRQAPTHRATR